MKDYTVTWKVLILADTPHEAAVKAKELQMSEDSTSNFFMVKHDITGVTTDVDLDDDPRS